MRTAVLLFAAAACCALTCGCGRNSGPRQVDVDDVVADDGGGSNASEPPGAVRIAVGSVVTPRKGFVYYRQLIDYIGRSIGRPAFCLDSKTYAELSRLFRRGDIDMAFVCSLPYVEGKRRSGMELLVAPQVRGETVYQSYIIVPVSSSASRLEDLRGGTFAFCDPLSNTGTLVPTFMLWGLDETAEGFFSEYTYTYAHDRTIRIVGQGVVDGGAVHSLVWEYEKAQKSELALATKVIAKSKPYAIPPVVVRKDLDPDLKAALGQVLLDMHTTEEGRQILGRMMIDRFVRIDDSAYDPIREMEQVLQARKVLPE